MSDPIVILGLSGSARASSFSGSALLAAAGLLPDGASLEVFDLQGLPAFDPARTLPAPPRLEALKRQIRAADAVLLSVPEYLYSLLPVLDNALTCGAEPAPDNAWAGKPVAVIGTSLSADDWGRAQRYLRSRLLELALQPVEQPVLVIGQVHQAFDRHGAFRHAADRAAVADLLATLVGACRTARSRARTQDLYRSTLAAARPPRPPPATDDPGPDTQPGLPQGAPPAAQPSETGRKTPARAIDLSSSLWL